MPVRNIRARFRSAIFTHDARLAMLLMGLLLESSGLAASTPIDFGGPGNLSPTMSNWSNPQIGKITKVTPDGLGPHVWLSVRSDPTDPRNFAICGLRNGPDTARPLVAVLYTSRDGGSTWHLARSEGRGEYTSEVACAFDRKGHLFFTFSVESTHSGRTPHESKKANQGIVAVSKDMGLTWTDARAVHYLDAAVFVTDVGAGAQRSLVVFDDTDFGSYFTSPEASLRFGSPKRVEPLDPLPPGEYRLLADAGLMPDGTVGALFTDPDQEKTVPARIVMMRIDASGTPLKASLVTTLSYPYNPPHLDRSLRTLPDRSPGLASDPPESKRRFTYVTWHDRIDGRSRILMAISKDSGKTWDAPRVIDDSPLDPTDNRSIDASRPSIAVNKDGIVGVQWSEKNGRCWRFSASLDGGASFSKSVPINECPTATAPDVDFASYMRLVPGAHLDMLKFMKISEPVTIMITDWRPYRRGSRVFGLSATPDGFFRSIFTGLGDRPDQVFSAQIRPLGTGESRRAWCGAPDIGGGDAWLEFTSIQFDGERSEIRLGVVVVSKKEKPQTQPLLFKVERMKSPYGALTPVDPDMVERSGTFGWAFEPGQFRDLPDGSAVKEAYRLNSVNFTFSRPREILIELKKDVVASESSTDAMSIMTLLAGRFDRACPATADSTEKSVQ